MVLAQWLAVLIPCLIGSLIDWMYDWRGHRGFQFVFSIVFVILLPELIVTLLGRYAVHLERPLPLGGIVIAAIVAALIGFVGGQAFGELYNKFIVYQMGLK